MHDDAQPWRRNTRRWTWKLWNSIAMMQTMSPKVKNQKPKTKHHTTVCDAVLKNSPNMRLLGPFLHLTHSCNFFFVLPLVISYGKLPSTWRCSWVCCCGTRWLRSGREKKPIWSGSREIDFASPEDFVASEEIASHSNASDREKVLRLHDKWLSKPL